MADKNPFANLGLSQMGAERQYMTSLLDPEHKRNIKRGILGAGFQAVGAEDFFNKMFGKSLTEKPVDNIQNYQFTKDFTPGANLQLSGTGIGINPNKINLGMGLSPAVPGQTPVIQQTQPSVDDEVDEAWGNKKSTSFTPRDTSLDQLPQQFAQSPVAPPVGQYPQVPQTGGLAKFLTSFLV